MRARVLPEPAFGGKGTHHHTRALREDVTVVLLLRGPYLSARGSSPTAGSGPRYVCVCWCNTLKQTNKHGSLSSISCLSPSVCSFKIRN